MADSQFRNNVFRYDPGMGMDELCDALNRGLYIGVDSPSGATPPISSALISFLQSGTGAVARTVQSKLRETVNVKDFGAKGDFATDDTAAIQAAFDAVAASSKVYFPLGNYKVTSQVTISKDRVNIEGDGPYATTITFAPTANGTCFKFINGVTTINQGSLSNMTFWSDDSTYVKTAIEIVDMSGYRMENLVIGGSVVVGNSGFWADSSNGSIGIRTRGRDSSSFRDITVFANKPLFISPNPNAGIQISADHFNFHNWYMGAASNPCVTIEAGCVNTEISFTGYQAWIQGHGGLYWVDATTPGSSHGLLLQNVRWENATDDTKYFVHIDLASGLQQLRVDGGQSGGARGFYLRGIVRGSFRNFSYSDTSREAMNANATVGPLTFENCLWNTGSTATLTGLTVYNNQPSTTSMPLPENGFIQVSVSGGGSYNKIEEATISGVGTSVNDLATMVIGGQQQTGIVLITTSDDVSAIFELRGASNSTAEMSDPAGFFSTTQGTASSYNVYWDSGASRYVIENKRGGARTIRVTRFGKAQ